MPIDEWFSSEEEKDAATKKEEANELYHQYKTRDKIYTIRKSNSDRSKINFVQNSYYRTDLKFDYEHVKRQYGRYYDEYYNQHVYFVRFINIKKKLKLPLKQHLKQNLKQN